MSRGKNTSGMTSPSRVASSSLHAFVHAILHEARTHLSLDKDAAAVRSGSWLLSGSQVTPALLLQFHEPDDSGFDDLRLRDERDIFRLSSCHIFARIPTCRKGEVWHGFAHGLDALLDRRGVISQHVQSGSEGDHFDLNLLADRAVILSRIAHVIEGEIHNGGVIDVDLHSQPMRVRLVGVSDFGVSTDFGASTDFGERTDFGGSMDLGRGTDLVGSAVLRRTADLRAQHQGERNGGHSGEDGE